MSPPFARLPESVQLLKNLADPTRLRLLMLLGHGELAVGEICRVLGQSQPRVSRHLRLLAEAGFLDRFREQRRVYYRAPAAGPRLPWLRELLAAIDPEDPALHHDRVRTSEVVGDCARLAADELGGGGADPDDAGLALMLREELGLVPLGELLDVGTGAGRVLGMLGPRASHAIGLDLSAPALRLARARLHGREFAHCEFHRGNMYALPFADGRFDTVSLGRVLAGAERPVEVLSEAGRVLRRTGRVLAVEKFDDVEASTGLNPLQAMRAWFEAAGLPITRLKPCELESGHYLLALAGAAVASA